VRYRLSITSLMIASTSLSSLSSRTPDLACSAAGSSAAGRPYSCVSGCKHASAHIPVPLPRL
jgi:hypothetical protein